MTAPPSPSFAWRFWKKRVQPRTFRYLLSLRGSPEAVAFGFSLGVFVSFTPTIGFQWLCSVALATLFKVSRPAAVLPILITNPATIPPVFYVVYKIGALFFPGPPAEIVRHHLQQIMGQFGRLRFFEFWEHFQSLMRLGWEAMVPLWIGGIICGVLGGLITYPLALRGLKAFYAFRARRKEQKRRRWILIKAERTALEPPSETPEK